MLSQKLLSNVAWYNVNAIHREHGYHLDDVVTIHFKSWWKRKITITTERIRRHSEDDKYITFTMRNEFKELIEQLREAVLLNENPPPKKRRFTWPRKHNFKVLDGRGS